MVADYQKANGSYYTPDSVVRALVQWAVRRPNDCLLDPSCGNGRFLTAHRHAVGIEHDTEAAADATQRAPWATVHTSDFFAWAAETNERFEVVAGNPPFIRYQRFSGHTRERALAFCQSKGVRFSSLTSSWAPFLVGAAALLKSGGRMAFVVPAEIGHAPYAAPLLTFLVDHFDTVQVVALREKLFPDLSEDCWLLYADGYGGATDSILFSAVHKFDPADQPPCQAVPIGMAEWTYWNRRLRPFILPFTHRALYRSVADATWTRRLGDVARVGIGYVTGDNDFFHLRPSKARATRIPDQFLLPTARNSRALRKSVLTHSDVQQWISRDEPVLLLRIPPEESLPPAVRRYLESPAAERTKLGYKCRNRDPWYAVPDVTIPDAFLSYMSGDEPSLVRNAARCTCTNSLHAVLLNGTLSCEQLSGGWSSPFTTLSCEMEGHPLGGGMLKLEPREAARVIIDAKISADEQQRVQDAIRSLRKWRHYG